MKKVKDIDKEELMKKNKKTLDEFKEFISQGNVVDLAVGVIIGSAFGKIVTSLVNDILMPLIGIVIGGVDFSSLSVKVVDANINYGMFIQNIIDFLIVAICIFMFTKFIARFNRKQEEEKEATVEVDEKLETLKEIRDLLKKQK